MTAYKQERLQELNHKRQAEIITPEEYTGLLELIEEMENYTASRVLYLTELAQLRKTTVRDLMKEFN